MKQTVEITSLFAILGGCTTLISLNACTTPDSDRTAHVTDIKFPQPDDVDVEWQDIRALVVSRCITCHGEPGPAGDLDLEIAENVQREALAGRLLDRINDTDDPMPPNGMLPEETRAFIAEWVSRGASITPTDRPAKLAPGMRRNTASGDPVNPVAADAGGFEFLQRMQGHWVGTNNIMGADMPWFAFDYRPAGPSLVHGMFEGGTMGNLATTFFYARISDTDTIVARNGGVLNGIYRTSYFVLDHIEQDDQSTTYRFVDAIGGKGIMWMSLKFRGDSLEWRSYTSRLGEMPEPMLHMAFKATRRSSTLADAALEAFDFAARKPTMELPDGFKAPDWGEFGRATSTSYLWQSKTLSYEQMGILAEDPLKIDDLKNLARLSLDVDRTVELGEAKLLMYMSAEPITNDRGVLRSEWGYVKESVFDSVLLFSELDAEQTEFTYTYLHPGEYYLTVVADKDGDGIPGTPDLFFPSQKIEIKPGSHPRVSIDQFVR